MQTDSALTASVPISTAWRATGLAFATTLGVFLALQHDLTRSLADQWWNSSEYGHGLLILGITLYLTWRDRARWLVLAPRPALAGLFALALVVLLVSAGNIADVLRAGHLGLLLFIPALTWALCGTRVAMALAFPLAYLMFAAPIWDVFSPLLQDLTAVMVVKALQVLGISVYLEGHNIVIPNGQFTVAETCSGMRYFVAGIALSTLLAWLNAESLGRRLVVVALGLAISISANWIRVLIIVLAGYLTDMQHPFVKDHIAMGWVVFFTMMFPLFWWAPRMPQPTQRRATPAHTGPAHIGAHALLTVALMAIAIAGAGFGGEQWVRSPAWQTNLYIIPSAGPVAQWNGPLPANSPGWGIAFGGAQTEAHASYTNGEHSISLYLAAYGHERQGAELINETNVLYGEAWRPLSSGPVRPGAGGDPAFGELQLRSADGRAELLVWYWYDIAGKITASPRTAKFYGALANVRGRAGSAVIALAIPHNGDTAGARATLAAFTQEILPLLRMRPTVTQN